jgi:hypothetical protein
VSAAIHEPDFACVQSRPCDTCDVFPDCSGAETWLERRGREINREIKIADKFTEPSLVAARMGATGR